LEGGALAGGLTRTWGKNIFKRIQQQQGIFEMGNIILDEVRAGGKEARQDMEELRDMFTANKNNKVKSRSIHMLGGGKETVGLIWTVIEERVLGRWCLVPLERGISNSRLGA
jgi:hypothetical protein